MSPLVLIVAVLIISLAVLGVGILIGVMAKGINRTNSGEPGTEQEGVIDLERGVSDVQGRDRRNGITIGCLLTVIIVLIGVLITLGLAAYMFIQLVRGGPRPN